MTQRATGSDGLRFLIAGNPWTSFQIRRHRYLADILRWTVVDQGIDIRPRAIFTTVVVGAVLALFGSITFSAFSDTSTEAIATSLEAILPTPLVAAAAPSGADGIGLVDPSQGI